jgi:phosphoribosylanthranilate isomerase
VRTRVKFCGCRSVEDVMRAAQCGADAVGMIFAPSKRRITLETAKEIAASIPAFITPVGVFSDPSFEEVMQLRSVFPDLVVQLHGDESPAFASSIDGKVIKTIHVAEERADAKRIREAAHEYPRALLLFDTVAGAERGGTGVRFDWRPLVPVAREREVVVAGGLTPQNVGECVRTVRPFGVDVCSGVETDLKKDVSKMRAFVRAVRDADAA